MRISLVFIITIVFAFPSSGQKVMPDFGKIDMADLQLKSCSFEPGADAMILFEIQDIDYDIFTFESKIKSEKRVRIKIFNEKGYKYASIRIPYFSKKGIAKIKELSGAVYNLDANGKMVVQKLEKKDFFKEKAAEYVGMVSFTFPNLRPGCIIEYSYTTIENNINFLLPWMIQDNIPVQYTSRIITTPVQVRVFERPFATDSIPQTYYLLKSDRFRRTTYFKENIPSFKAEPYMSSVSDHLVRASFSLYPFGANYYLMNQSHPERVWNNAGTQFIKSAYFKNQVLNPIPGTEKIIDSAKKIASVRDRIGFLYAEVKKRIPGKIEQTLKSENLAEAWGDSSATSAETNLILLNLLLKADISAMPVMVSTRNNGKVNRDFPNTGQMNGLDVLALDSSKYFMLDASIKFQSFLNPPLNILNREVFLMGRDSSQWLTISDNRPLHKQSAYVVMDMNDQGNMDGTGNIQYYDYAKSYKLDTTLREEENDKSEGADNNKIPGLTIISNAIGEPGAEEDPLFETIEFKYEPQKTDDFVFINPQILTKKNKNPFISETRDTDLDFGCNQEFILTMQINLPSSYTVEHLPKNITVRAPDSSFFYKISYNSDATKVNVAQSFSIQRALYSKDEYPGIKDFFKNMYALMAEEIILKKKK